jgi:hypothetical protein
MKHPMQPIILDAHGVARFQANPIVKYLLEHGGLDLNDLAIAKHRTGGWTKQDEAHFAQLIGYSVSGWGDLSYVKPKWADKAQAIVQERFIDGRDQ